jgi:hypothetical protein
MRWFGGKCGVVSLALIALVGVGGAGQNGGTQKRTTYALNATSGLEFINANGQIVDYRGRRALHLTVLRDGEEDKGSMMGLVNGTNFHNGTIEVEVAGVPIAAMDPTGRGFVGVVFRVQQHIVKAENIYLRPTNGRADDQLRRNHAVQYESLPDFPWDRLRSEQPGVYESYADLEAGAWTKMKIEVAGTTAKLYVNGAEQPCLIVNDLKLGDSRGQIGLWAFVATDAYFSNLAITKAD